jgi:flagellar biosynthesis component FlhA
MVEIHPESTALCGFDLVRPYLHPRTQYECSWVRRNGSLRQLLDAGQIRAFDFLQILALELGEAIRTNPEDGLSVTEIYRQLKQTEKKHPGLVSEAFAKAAASVPRLAEVMHALVRGGLGARDLRQTLESLASYCASQGQALSDDQNLETDQVVQFVRRVRRRELLQPLYGSRQSVIVVTIDEAVAETLTDAEEVPAQGGLAIPADVVQTLRRTLEGVLYGIRTRGAAPVALLCSSELRPKLERFLAVLGVKLPVLGMDELDPRTVLEPAGVWTS